VTARPPLREVIARHGLAARRALGQHFLLDANLTARIVREAGSLAGRHVVEIGPGPGGLTRALLGSEAASVTVVEIDRRAIAAIGELAELEPRLRVIAADALATDVAALIPPPRQVVANLPYNIATPLLVGWLRQATAFERLTLMFQQEVAERICAEPDTSAYGRLSVLAQWTCSATLLLRIPPTAFVPPPKVFSAVVGFVPHELQPAPALFTQMERLTAAAFGQRRKMLRGALKPLGGEALLRAADIVPERRAETLTVADFDRLARLIASREVDRSPTPAWKRGLRDC
jgi:16S rRNA (adenine1518-N6/adenine1519-N6)-dimethyltransferase